MDTILVVGATGGIGHELARWCLQRWPAASVFGTHRSADAPITPELARVHWLPLDLQDDDSIAGFGRALGELASQLDLVLVCSGWLHDGQHMPEKALREVSASAFSKALRVNASAPLMLIAQLEPLLLRKPGQQAERARILLLSAKVGSISDNSLGGWHAYRMSKAALNMGVRNLGIEFARTKRKPLVVAVHPGTTHSDLSEPFAKSGLPVVRADITAQRLGEFVEQMCEEQQGLFFHWDGTPLAF